MSPLDALAVHQLPKGLPLAIFALRAEQARCVLCDADIFRDEWAVTLPWRSGRAHPHCAADHGWTVR